jgi:hypothetical protein
MKGVMNELKAFKEDKTRDADCQKLLNLAQMKLVFTKPLNAPRVHCSIETQIAVVDIRIQFNFEVGRISVSGHAQELVSSHMRTAISIPAPRAYVRSLYTSEPILAEAAARHLQLWREQEKKLGLPTTSFDIVKNIVKQDLVSQGEIGEVVGRLLLTEAHDCAINSKPAPYNFSDAVPVVEFFKHLFAPNIAQQIEDRIGHDGRPFKDIFKNSVINFTHFARWGRHTNMDATASFACFLRHAAIICRVNFDMIDLAIPVLMDSTRATLSADNMTAIFIQIRRRVHRKSNPNLVGIDSTSFPTGLSYRAEAEENAKRENRHYDPLEHSKYSYFDRPCSSVAIVMDLGYPVRNNVYHDIRTTVPKSSVSSNNSAKHTQFDIFAYGCDSHVYNVVKPGADEDAMTHILGLDELYSNHPDKSVETLQMVAQQLPNLETTLLHALYSNLGEGESGDEIETPVGPRLRLLPKQAS